MVADDSRCGQVRHQNAPVMGFRQPVDEYSTLHDPHLHTNVAWPLLPDNSLDSFARTPFSVQNIYIYIDQSTEASRKDCDRTNRLTLTQFGCVSRQDVHCTRKVK